MMAIGRSAVLAVAISLGGGAVQVTSAQQPTVPRAPRDTAARPAAPRDTAGVGRLTPIDTAVARRMAEERLGRPVTQDELIERLRQSGYTRDEAKAILAEMGIDPGIADTYFDIAEGKAPAPGTAGDKRARAGADSATSRVLARADSGRVGAPTVFGLSLFRRVSQEFEPETVGPVDPDYRVGPGDEVIVRVTGDVEFEHSASVSREGQVLLPDVGGVSVNGLTLSELRMRLQGLFRSVYATVGSTTHILVTLGSLRVAQVYLTGEVARPDAYRVSAAATVFTALYQAGGPSERGSFRRIEVWRGEKVVKTVDLYDYLVRGDSRNDIRLEHGDRIFVPVVGPQARIEGAVRRPAIYELKQGDGLKDLLANAGGLEADAHVQRVQIDRILPPVQRRPGVDRVLYDVDVASLESGAPIPLQNGDVVQVFAVSNLRRHRLTVAGEVRRPGVYEWAEGMTLWSLMDRAQGLAERAYTPRAHIFRLNEDDGTRRLIRTALLADSAGRPLQDLPLADADSVVVYSRQQLRNPESVAIDGFVKRPGRYALAEGMTLEDLIIAAGGFLHGAYRLSAEVARLPNTAERTDTTAQVYQVSLSERTQARGGAADDGAASAAAAARALRGDLPFWLPSPDEFELKHGDQVYIRKSPGFGAPETVKVTGEVLLPGTYVLRTRAERLTDVIRRAGGLTAEAAVSGMQLVRKGDMVATDLQKAVERADSRFNVALEPGDSLFVPKKDPTVLVTGAVAFEARVLYEPGKGLDHYVAQAGGYTDQADKGRVSVTYQNGEREIVDRFLVLKFKPEPKPGSNIFVPARPEGSKVGFDWDKFVTRLTGIATSLLALKLAVDQFQKN